MPTTDAGAGNKAHGWGNPAPGLGLAWWLVGLPQDLGWWAGMLRAAYQLPWTSWVLCGTDSSYLFLDSLVLVPIKYVTCAVGLWKSSLFLVTGPMDH